MRLRPVLALAAGTMMAGSLATPASAVTVLCGPWKLAEKSAAKLGQVPVSRGQIGPEVVIVVTASPDGRFTMFSVDTTGQACLMFEGEGWEPGGLPSELRGGL